MNLLLLAASLAAVSPGGPSARPAPHDLAFINDPRSHGQVGDMALSLNEVIQLHNRTLQVAQLSVFEQAQLGGSGTDIAWGEIDSANVPVITVERDLDPILDMPHGLLLRGGGLPPVLDFSGPGITRGIQTFSNGCSFENLVLRGGPYGIDLVQTNPVGVQNGTFLRDMVFENLATFGFRVTAGAPAAQVFVRMNRCRFTSMADAFLVDERQVATTTSCVLAESVFRGVATAIDVQLGDGGSALYDCQRLDVEATVVGMRWRRGAGDHRPLELSTTQCLAVGPTACEVRTSPVGGTVLTMRMDELRGTSAFPLALGVTPREGRCTGAIDELVGDGNVYLLGGSAGWAMTNARLRNGIVLAGSLTGSAIGFADTRFDGCSLSSVGSVPLVLRECCVVGGNVGGAAGATWQFVDSHVGAVVGNATQVNPRPAPQLGSLAVTPANVVTGGPLVWQAVLPAGLAGVFTLGLAVDPAALVLLPQPLHVYSDPAWTATIPGLWRLQQSFPFTVPNDPLLVGTGFVAQMAVIPDPGVAAPWINLPPGRRFVLR